MATETYGAMINRLAVEVLEDAHEWAGLDPLSACLEASQDIDSFSFNDRQLLMHLSEGFSYEEGLADEEDQWEEEDEPLLKRKP